MRAARHHALVAGNPPTLTFERPCRVLKRLHRLLGECAQPGAGVLPDEGVEHVRGRQAGRRPPVGGGEGVHVRGGGGAGTAAHTLCSRSAHAAARARCRCWAPRWGVNTRACALRRWRPLLPLHARTGVLCTRGDAVHGRAACTTTVRACNTARTTLQRVRLAQAAARRAARDSGASHLPHAGLGAWRVCLATCKPRFHSPAASVTRVPTQSIGRGPGRSAAAAAGVPARAMRTSPTAASAAAASAILAATPPVVSCAAVLVATPLSASPSTVSAACTPLSTVHSSHAMSCAPGCSGGRS